MNVYLSWQDCQRIVKPLDPAVQWPKERTDHSSVVVSSVSSDGVRRPHLVVLGGRDGKGDIIPDCWIMDIEWKNWKKVIAFLLKFEKISVPNFL